MLVETLIILGLFFPPAGALAAEDGDETLPDMELLEFIGEWETESGEWIDPAELYEVPPSREEERNDEKDDS